MAARLLLALVLATVVSAQPAVAAPSPQLGRTAIVNTVSGTVLVKDKGERRFSRLPRSLTAVRMGAVLDATDGHVRLRTAAGAGKPLNYGVFWDGAFRISQAKRPGGLTTLSLVGGNVGQCGAGARASRVVQRRLWGDARGNVRTHGHNGSGTVRSRAARYRSGTVRATRWLTEDRCDGTLTAVKRGTVHTEADGQLQFDVEAGQVIQYYCDFQGQAPISRLFCTLVLSSPADGLWGAGILTIGDAPNYDLCLGEPSGGLACGTFDFTPPDSDGFRQSVVVCGADEGPGDYAVGWFISGTRLGPPIGFTSTAPPQPLDCIHDP
jgi:hypothetical protein